jgi:hypothetical protein
MEYKVKEQTTFDANVAPAGPLAVVSTPPAVQMAEWTVETSTSMKMEREVEYSGYREFDQEFPAIAEVVEETLSFQRKRFFAFEGLKGQVKVFAGALAATAVVIGAFGFAGAVQNNRHELDRLIDAYNEASNTQTCMLQAPPEEGGQCLH